MRSNALPCGIPSAMSSSTTSYRPLSTRRCAVVPPTLPAPITVIFSRATVTLLGHLAHALFVARFMRGPPGHFEILGAHEILAEIEIQLDLLPAVRLGQ